MANTYLLQSRDALQDGLIRETLDALDRAMGEGDYVKKRLGVAELIAREIRDAPQIAFDKHHVWFTVHVKSFVERFAESREERDFLYTKVMERLFHAASADIVGKLHAKEFIAKMQQAS